MAKEKQPFGQHRMAGAHRPSGFQEADESLRPLNREEGTQTFSTRDVKRASEMESFLFWDSQRPSSAIYEMAAFPCLPGASKDDRLESGMDDPKNSRGKWECLMRSGLVFEQAVSLKFLMMDGHGSHLWMHRLLLGQPIDLPDALMEHLPFWKDLAYRNLPLVCFPLPWRNVLVDGVTIHYIPGTVCGMGQRSFIFFFNHLIQKCLNTMTWKLCRPSILNLDRRGASAEESGRASQVSAAHLALWDSLVWLISCCRAWIMACGLRGSRRHVWPSSRLAVPRFDVKLTETTSKWIHLMKLTSYSGSSKTEIKGTVGSRV